MNILILGGGRFMGPCIVNAFLEKNHAVTVFNRGTHDVQFRAPVTYIKGDRDDELNIQGHFDVVVDTCAYRATQTKQALRALSFNHYVHISTAAVYQKSDVFPFMEDQSPLGDWPLWGRYSVGKVECERVLQDSGASFASLRPVYILGKNNYIDREQFIYSGLKGRLPLVLPGNGQALVQFTFVQDVARAVCLLAESRVSGAFNCCSDEAITLSGLVSMMADIVGVQPKIEYNADADGAQFFVEEFPFANEHFLCSNDKLKGLGFTFIPLREGLKADYYDWYKKITD